MHKRISLPALLLVCCASVCTAQQTPPPQVSLIRAGKLPIVRLPEDAKFIMKEGKIYKQEQ